MDHAFKPGQEWTTTLGDTVRITEAAADRVFYQYVAFDTDLDELSIEPDGAVCSRSIPFTRQWTLSKEAS